MTNIYYTLRQWWRAQKLDPRYIFQKTKLYLLKRAVKTVTKHTITVSVCTAYRRCSSIPPMPTPNVFAHLGTMFYNWFVNPWCTTFVYQYYDGPKLECSWAGVIAVACHSVSLPHDCQHVCSLVECRFCWLSTIDCGCVFIAVDTVVGSLPEVCRWWNGFTRALIRSDDLYPSLV